MTNRLEPYFARLNAQAIAEPSKLKRCRIIDEHGISFEPVFIERGSIVSMPSDIAEMFAKSGQLEIL